LGGNGGTALGGGLCNANLGTATLTKTIVTRNKAQGGSAGSGGTAGVGQGGGVYNGAVISIDAVDLIFGNEADEFPDRFGC
jgi:hypothetical protein